MTGKPSAQQARMEVGCVTVSQCPWLNKPLISYMFVCSSRNDIPRGREHISVPVKHLPLLCCPSSSLCHPAHCLMDGADGCGWLPNSDPTQLTHQREGAREATRQNEKLDSCSILPCSELFQGQKHGGSSISAQKSIILSPLRRKTH